MIKKRQLNPMDYVIPLSSLPYMPFADKEEERKYLEYMFDLKIRLYQRGGNYRDKWYLISMEEGTAKPIFIEEELKEHINSLKEKYSGGEIDFVCYKTSLSDLDKITNQIDISLNS